MKLADRRTADSRNRRDVVHYTFPREHWRCLRTNNPLERILREVRRRTRTMGISRWEIGADAGCSATVSHSRPEMGNTTLHGHESLGGSERSRMNTPANNFSAPLRGAEHQQSYASTNVRKILSST
jgi:hypothetical protein